MRNATTVEKRASCLCSCVQYDRPPAGVFVFCFVCFLCFIFVSLVSLVGCLSLLVHKTASIDDLTETEGHRANVQDGRHQASLYSICFTGFDSDHISPVHIQLLTLSFSSNSENETAEAEPKQHKTSGICVSQLSNAPD